MKKSELRAIQDKVRHGGNQLDRQEAISSGLVRMRDEVRKLEEILAAQREWFARELEKWTGRTEMWRRPFEVGEQLREGKAYLIAAVFGAGFDCFTGGLLTSSIGLPYWLGVLITLFFVLVLKGGLRFLFRDPERPRLVLERLRRQIGLWSFLTFVFAITALLSALRLPGSWAAALIPFYAGALLLTTLSLCILSASLWVAWQLLSWSRAAERDYSVKELDLREAVVLERYLESLAPIPERQAVDGVAEVSGVSAEQPQRLGGGPRGLLPAAGGPISAILGALLAGLLSACTGVDAKDSRQVSASVTPTEPGGSSAGSDINLLVDLSGSPDPTALRESARNVLRDLPGICRQTCARRLHVRHIREDAWVSLDSVILELPACPSPTPAAALDSMGEIGELPHIKAAREQARGRLAQSALEQAERVYAEKVREAVASLSEEKIVPEEIRPARCSDIYGSLRRASYGGDTQRLNLVLTDADDSCSPVNELRPIEPGVGIVTILFLTPRAGHLGWNDFDTRRAAVSRFLPAGTLVLPHFEDPGRAVTRALSLKPE